MKGNCFKRFTTLGQQIYGNKQKGRAKIKSSKPLKINGQVPEYLTIFAILIF